MIGVLIKEGQNPSLEDSDGRTPLWRAVEEGNEDAARFLSSHDRKTFTKSLSMRDKTFTDRLLQYAAKNIRDQRRRTALRIGIITRDANIMEQSIKHGLDIKSKDVEGNTSIQLAMRQYDVQAVDWLLNNGAEINHIDHYEWMELLV